MKKILSLVLALAVFSTLAMAAVPGAVLSDEMPSAESGAVIGGSWTSFFVGAGCALGIGAGIAVLATGVGAAVTAATATAVSSLLTAGAITTTLASCAATLGI